MGILCKSLSGPLIQMFRRNTYYYSYTLDTALLYQIRHAIYFETVPIVSVLVPKMLKSNFLIICPYLTTTIMTRLDVSIGCLSNDAAMPKSELLYYLIKPILQYTSHCHYYK
jgi:hypothetical protein